MKLSSLEKPIMLGNMEGKERRISKWMDSLCIKMDGFTVSNNWGIVGGPEGPDWGQIIPKKFIWSLVILEKIYVI